MLPGSQKQIEVRLYHEWNYDEYGDGEQTTTDYAIEAKEDNSDLVTVSVSDSENEKEQRLSQ